MGPKLSDKLAKLAARIDTAPDTITAINRSEPLAAALYRAYRNGELVARDDAVAVSNGLKVRAGADLPLTPGCNVILRNGDLRGPLKPSPQVDRLWLDPNGFMWDQSGTLWGHDPDGNMDIVEVAIRAIAPVDGLAENARLRADAQAAVALVVERAAAMIEGTAYTSNGDKRSLEPVGPGLVGMDMHHATIAEAIRALAPVDGLAMVEALRKERDDAQCDHRAVNHMAKLAEDEVRLLRGNNLTANNISYSLRQIREWSGRHLTDEPASDRDRLAADLAAAQAQIKALRGALEGSANWMDALLCLVEDTDCNPDDEERWEDVIRAAGMQLAADRKALAALPATTGNTP